MKVYQNHISFYEHNDIEIIYGVCIHSFPIHIHKSFCFGIITHGYACLVIGDSKTTLRAGDCYVIPAYTPHTLSSVGDNEFRYLTCCIKNSHRHSVLSDAVFYAKKYIENASKEFNLNELSEAMHFSKYHLIREFKEQFGITPYQYYISEKVKKIRQGLHSQLSLSDLVFDLGFSDQSHLCNTFKKHMGISPLQYTFSYYCS